MRRALVFAALAGAVVVSAAPAAVAAAPENGGCPVALTPLDEAAQLALAEEMGIPAEVVMAALEQLDRNGDRTLCFLSPGGEIKVFPSGHINIIDNTLAR